MPGFHDTISQFVDGQPVAAAVVNTPLAQLLDNDLYLRDTLNATSAGTALFARNVTFDPAVTAGKPVYYNSTNHRYELALADGTVKENVVGICFVKSSSTLGDILILGYAALDISSAVGGAVAASRYWLSTTTPGALTSVQPNPSVLCCTADGAGHVFVVPQVRDLTGPAGPTGGPGSAGATGPPGPPGTPGHPIPDALTASGTTADAFVGILTQTSTHGLLGSLSVKNTGVNYLTVSLALTDAYGNSATFTTNVIPGGSWSANLGNVIMTGCLPPHTIFTLSLKSTTAGSPTSYQARGVVLY